jgi:hypothetical protein
MLHLSDARKIIESGDPFDISFWKKNGEIVHAKNVVCLSSYFHGNTFNIKFLNSGEIRKIKAVLIFNISGEEVYV